jgi:hypothetical protein
LCKGGKANEISSLLSLWEKGRPVEQRTFGEKRRSNSNFAKYFWKGRKVDTYPPIPLSFGKVDTFLPFYFNTFPKGGGDEKRKGFVEINLVSKGRKDCFDPKFWRDFQMKFGGVLTPNGLCSYSPILGSNIFNRRISSN